VQHEGRVDNAPDRLQMVEIERRSARERDMHVADADGEQVDVSRCT
jgi:hypothetical protein